MVKLKLYSGDTEISFIEKAVWDYLDKLPNKGEISKLDGMKVADYFDMFVDHCKDKAPGVMISSKIGPIPLTPSR